MRLVAEARLGEEMTARETVVNVTKESQVVISENFLVEVNFFSIIDLWKQM